MQSWRMFLLFLDETPNNLNNCRTLISLNWPGIAGGGVFKDPLDPDAWWSTSSGDSHIESVDLNLQHDVAALISETNEPTSSLDAVWNGSERQATKHCSLNLHVICSLIAR